MGGGGQDWSARKGEKGRTDPRVGGSLEEGSGGEHGQVGEGVYGVDGMDGERSR